MKNTLIVQFCIALMLLTTTGFAESCRHVKYVQGGAQPGNGSKSSPYNSLAAAQANSSWKTLIVLPSETPLEGNLVLQDGQNVIGCADPTAVDSGTVATLTTTVGNTLTLLGSHKIENLRFENIDHVAIELTQAQDVSIKNCYISNFNLGNYFEFSFWESAAIQGFQNTRSGTLDIKKVIIENGTSGIQFSAAGSAIRKMQVKDSIVRDLEAELIGIAIGGASNEQATIYTVFHDNLVNNLQSDTFGAGLWATSSHLLPEAGGTTFADWKNNSLFSVGNNSEGFLWTLFLVNGGSSNPVNWTVNNNYLSEGLQGALFQFEDTGSKANVVFNGNTVVNHQFGAYNHFGGSGETVEARCNSFDQVEFGGFGFYSLIDLSYTKATIYKNKAKNMSLVGVLDIANDVGQWANLDISLHHNCFTDSEIGISDFTDGPNTIHVKARKNAFVAIQTDVLRDPGAAVLDLRYNYWDGGPATVVEQGSGPGSVDVSHFLTRNPCSKCTSSQPVQSAKKQTTVRQYDGPQNSHIIHFD